MAERVVFIIVAEIIKVLGSAAVKETGLIWRVSNDLEKLEDTLLTIKAVLTDAEKKQSDNEQIQNWVDKLEDVVYDADDLVDEFHTEGLKNRITISGNTLTNKVLSILSSPTNLAFQQYMSHRIKGIRETLSRIGDDKAFHLESLQEITHVPGQERVPKETHSYISEEEIIGRDDDKREILMSLLNPNFKDSVSVLPIVGMGGLGKTTLAQCVFNDESVTTYFEPRMWVCVSNLFDLNLIVQKIIRSGKHYCPVNLGLDELQCLLRDMLKKRRFLLVLDDVWIEDRSKWLDLKKLLDGGERGSKILVTTRSEKVVNITKTSTVVPFNLKGLEKDKSWCLFKRMAFEEGQEPVDPSIVGIGREIVDKCQGVPLTIKTIGCLLYSKNTKTEWSALKDGEFSKASHGENSILSTLEISYKCLPSHLKHCFAYCGLFPKDYEIDVQMLIKLWMANGFVKCSNHNQSLEDIGYEYFMDLLHKSFFCEGKTNYLGVIRSCKMHDLMNDLASAVAGNNITIVDSKLQRFHAKLRHISSDFHYLNHIPKSLFRKNKIRSIIQLQYSANPNAEVILNNLSKFKLLRALMLNDLGMETLPKSIKKLKHLRYLDLSDNNIKMLPNSITKLLNLQTLILNRCKHLMCLPPDMKNLRNLRHLEMDNCTSLTHMPCGLGELTSLCTLSLFVVGESKNSMKLCDLNTLDNLRGDLEIRNLGHGKDVASECKAVNLEEKDLQSLSLEWSWPTYPIWVPCSYAVENDEESLLNLQPSSSLKVMKVRNYMGARFSAWISSLANLVVLDLNDCGNCKYLPPLDQLSALQEIRLSNFQSLEYMSDSDEIVVTKSVATVSRKGKEKVSASASTSTSKIPFLPSLRRLELIDCPNLKGWFRMTTGEASGTQHSDFYFPSLSFLDIRGCPGLKFMPLFPEVESLFLTRCGVTMLLETVLEWKMYPLYKLKIMCLMSTDLSVLLQDFLFEIGDFSSLEHLALADTLVTPFLLNRAPLLKHLILENCLSSFPLNMNRLTKLESLRIENFQVLPESICQIVWLQSLEIHNCYELESLPDYISDLVSLWSLEIVNCYNLVSFPKSMENLISLWSLKVKNCPKLDSLPQGLLSEESLERREIEIVDCPMIPESRMSEPGEVIEEIPLYYMLKMERRLGMTFYKGRQREEKTEMGLYYFYCRNAIVK